MNPDIADYMMRRYQAFHFRCSVCKTQYYAQFSTVYDEHEVVVDYIRFDKEGAAYGLQAIRVLKACCGNILQVKKVDGVYDPTVPCGRDCFEATSVKCTCACGGLVHGVHLSQW